MTNKNIIIEKSEQLLNITKEFISPFIELPSAKKFLKEISDEENSIYNAEVLFSFFTADIIKEHVVFTR